MKNWRGSKADLELVHRLGERYRSIPGPLDGDYLKLCLAVTIDALAADFMNPEVYAAITEKHNRRRALARAHDEKTRQVAVRSAAKKK